MRRKTHHYHLRYPHLSTALLGLVIAIVLATFPQFHFLLSLLGELGYFGAFIAGVFFVSMTTVATSGLVLILIAQTHSPLMIALVAGAGAVFGDLLLFRYIRNSVGDEIRSISSGLTKNRQIKIYFSHPIWHWILPILGLIIIASPLPDEIGIGLVGLTHVSSRRFAAVSWVLNTIGIYCMLRAAQVITVL